MLPFYVLKEKLPAPKWHILKDILLYIISEQQIATLVHLTRCESVMLLLLTVETDNLCCWVGLQWHRIYSKFSENQPSGLKVEM